MFQHLSVFNVHILFYYKSTNSKEELVPAHLPSPRPGPDFSWEMRCCLRWEAVPCCANCPDDVAWRCKATCSSAKDSMFVSQISIVKNIIYHRYPRREQWMSGNDQSRAFTIWNHQRLTFAPKNLAGISTRSQFDADRKDSSGGVQLGLT